MGFRRAVELFVWGERIVSADRDALLANAACAGYDDRMDPSFDQMTPAERILHVQDLWDRIAADAEMAPLSPAQAAEIDRRIEAYTEHPGASIPWEVAREQIRRRH